MRIFDFEKTKRDFKLDRNKYLRKEIRNQYEIIRKAQQKIEDLSKELQKGANKIA